MRPVSIASLFWAVRLAIVAVALGCAVPAGCALRYPPADPRAGSEDPSPAAAELRALLDAPSAAVHREAPFELRFYPTFVLAGGSSWLTCHAPPSWKAARIATTFDGKGASDRPAYLYAPELIVAIPCGRWAAACTVLLPNGDVRRTERAIESRGECNSGGRP